MMCEGVLEMWGKFEISRGLTRPPPPLRHHHSEDR